MKIVTIRHGRNIPLKGAARREIYPLPLPPRFSFPLYEFRPQQFRPLVREGDAVRVGQPILEEKDDTRIVIVSPASGRVAALVRGEKRRLLSIDIDTDGTQEALVHPLLSVDAPRADILTALLRGGLWPFLRQRPFGRIPSPDSTPKAIFIHAMSTEPLDLDQEAVLTGMETAFQRGIDVLRNLTEGPVYLCHAAGSQSRAVLDARGVERAAFAGPHPAGNVGTHIHHLAPLHKGETVWYIEARDVLRIAMLADKGVFCPLLTVAVAGEGLPEEQRRYVRAFIGAPVAALAGAGNEGVRYIAGSVLSGHEVGPAGALGMHTTQVTAIPAGGARRFLGWMDPGFASFSFSRVFASSFLPRGEVSLDTDTNGSERAMVLNHIYDELNTLDVLTYFLLKAIIAGEIEEMERLGILECAPEDFALAAFACPSKVDVPGLIARGLALMEEG